MIQNGGAKGTDRYRDSWKILPVGQYVGLLVQDGMEVYHSYEPQQARELAAALIQAADAAEAWRPATACDEGQYPQTSGVFNDEEDRADYDAEVVAQLAGVG